MLTDAIKQNIVSINLSELEALFAKFMAENSTRTGEEFVHYLYNSKRITAKEFKNIQAYERIHVSTISNIIDINDINKIQQKLKNSFKETVYTDTDTKDTKDTTDGDENYTLLESIDEGAMGEILIAHDNKLNRTVAYKRIHSHIAQLPSYLGRFYMEAQVTAQLQHPNIVPVYDLMTTDSSVGYAMKLIDGITLKAHIKETQNQYVKNGEPDEHHTLHARLEHFLKVCDAMHYAHRKGVIHRDLKPLNIMIGPYNEVYVMDWGIAKTVEVDKDTFNDKTALVGREEVDADDKTKQGQVMGTPAYMSPEQAEGEHDILDHRSDLYALGLILFELVTFHRAINGDDSSQVMMKARRGHIDPPPAYNKQADDQEQLLAIVAKATEYLPQDRYPTVAEFADDIRRFMHGEAIKARPETRKQKIMRWITHHRQATVSIVAYSVLVSFLSVVAILVMQMQAMIASQSEDKIINQFVSSVADKAQQIDAQFLKYTGILEGVTIGATNLLNQGSIDRSIYYTNDTIGIPGKGPPDYAFSKTYDFPISVDYHVYKLAPGVSEIAVGATLRRLNPLRHSFKSLLLKSYRQPVPIDDDAAARKIIMQEGLPLVWSYVGLEKGVMAAYPGRAGYPDALDPRERPWYQGTLDKAEITWLSPYIDVGGQGLLLPATSPIFNNNGKFIGVAVVETTLDYLRRRLLPLYNIEGLEEIYLVNDKAEVIVTSLDKSQTYDLGMMDNVVEKLDIFPNKYVTNKILRKQSGQYFYIDGEREKVVAFERLKSIGWYYIARADAEELLGGP